MSKRGGLILARQIIWDLAKAEVETMRATYDTTDVPRRDRKVLEMLNLERAAGRFDGLEAAARALTKAIDEADVSERMSG